MWIKTKNDIWEKLYHEAKRVQNARVIFPFIEAGGVAAAILTKIAVISKFLWIMRQERLLD